MGIDASNVEGYDLTAALSDMTYVKKQGLNGPIWALIALDSGNYEIPQISSGKTTAQVSREKLLSYILSSELTDGGFNLTKSDSQGADPDVTAMALQALYRTDNCWNRTSEADQGSSGPEHTSSLRYAENLRSIQFIWK